MNDERTQDKVRSLEQRWWNQMSTYRGSQCWDTLDEIEEAIAALTGETDVQVNRRLMQARADKMRNAKLEANKEQR